MLAPIKGYYNDYKWYKPIIFLPYLKGCISNFNQSSAYFEQLSNFLELKIFLELSHNMDSRAKNTSLPEQKSPKSTPSNIVSTSKRTYSEALRNTVRRYMARIATVKRQKLSHSGTNLFKEIRRKVSLPYASNRPLLEKDDSDESFSDDDDYVTQQTTGKDTEGYPGSPLRSHASHQLASGNDIDSSEDFSSDDEFVTQSTVLLDSDEEEIYELHKQGASRRDTTLKYGSGFSSDEESQSESSEDELEDSEGGCASDKGQDESEASSSEDEEEYLRLFEETENKMLTRMLLEHPDGRS
ncbi:unnamed protein product [Hermetia illucens]|uniref:Uncharacterized protein n=1 Tax=Hermetia illucens TaxID=343691 RepID=A0A7R8UT14_HERIL|nr:unnamed protein product [Hermetia illucens]